MNAVVYHDQDGRGPFVGVYLSRRNLVTLLAKLDGHPKNSACTIVRTLDNGTELVVTAEENAVHYGDRKPGSMHPDTEEAIT